MWTDVLSKPITKILCLKTYPTDECHIQKTI